MSKAESDPKVSGLLSIEQIAKSSGVKPDVFAGLKIHCGWGNGKKLSKKEFNQALKGFLNAPSDGRKSEGKKEVVNG